MAGRFYTLLNESSERAQSHRGTSFIIESLLLLVFVTASVAIVVQLLGYGYSQGVAADKLTSAVMIASNEAEQFTADPTMGSSEVLYIDADNGMQKVASRKSLKESDFEYNGEAISANDSNVFILTRNIKKDSLNSGELYNASISVECQGEEIYFLDTSKYIPAKPVDGTEDDDAIYDGEEGDA